MDSTTIASDNVVKQFEDINSRIVSVSERERALQLAMDEQNQNSKDILNSIEQLKDITFKVKAIYLSKPFRASTLFRQGL